MHSIASSAAVGKIVVGVDTHKHLHVAVALDELGARLGELTISADTYGYGALAAWAEQSGKIAAFGIEGTGSYGVGLAWPRALRTAKRMLPAATNRRPAIRSGGKVWRAIRMQRNVDPQMR